MEYQCTNHISTLCIINLYKYILSTFILLYSSTSWKLSFLQTMDLSKPAAVELAGESRAQAQAEQLKKDANQAFERADYGQAIAIYRRALELVGLSSDFQALIHSNLSAAYLKQGIGCDGNSDDKNSNKLLEKATVEAKLAVQLRPAWWRGYQRLAAAYRARDKPEKALYQLDIAIALNPEDPKLRDEVSVLRQEIGSRSRGDNLVPRPELDTEEEQIKRAIEKLSSVSTEEAKLLVKATKNNPHFRDLLEANRLVN
jgi:tetratricopeptide (TPR) repeat protein